MSPGTKRQMSRSGCKWLRDRTPCTEPWGEKQQQRRWFLNQVGASTGKAQWVVLGTWEGPPAHLLPTGSGPVCPITVPPPSRAQLCIPGDAFLRLSGQLGSVWIPATGNSGTRLEGGEKGGAKAFLPSLSDWGEGLTVLDLLDATVSPGQARCNSSSCQALPAPGHQEPQPQGRQQFPALANLWGVSCVSLGFPQSRSCHSLGCMQFIWEAIPERISKGVGK